MSPARKKDSETKQGGQTATCPWCSAAVPAESAACPSCGAQLRDVADGDILGVTQIDPSAASRLRRIRPRRITALLTGDGSAEEETGGKVEPPSEAVRREMLRLELAAIDAEIEARAQQAKAQQELPLEDLRPDGGPGAKSG